jgi:hypothetical protein
MERFRFSMAALMGLVALVAIGLAALKSANQLWVGLTTTIVLGVLLFAILGFIHSTGPMRRFWSGFAVFGWGYLVFIYAPWFNNNVGAYLPTQYLLQSLYSTMAQVHAPPPGLDNISVWLKPDGKFWVDGHEAADDSQLIQLFGNAVHQKKLSWLVIFYDQNSSEQSTSSERNRLRSVLQPAGTTNLSEFPAPMNPRWDDFYRVGHFLTALLAGLTGGLLTRSLLRRREDAAERCTGP